jgi:16S rRNA (uracil1498-N3)-methyltransferase
LYEKVDTLECHHHTMSYFLSETVLEANAYTTITGDEARHMLFSRRVQPGEAVELQDPAGNRWHCVVSAIDRDSVRVRVAHTVPVPAESPLQLTVAQALIDEKALDIVIQKATELGVSQLIIFPAVRTPVRFTGRASERMVRWTSIATEAAKQCGRLKGVDITWSSDIQQALASTEGTHRLFLSQSSKASLLSQLTPLEPHTPITLCIGPEGGWTEAEEMLLKERANSVVLGPRVLRAETAAIAAATLAQTMLGDMV